MDKDTHRHSWQRACTSLTQSSGIDTCALNGSSECSVELKNSQCSAFAGNLSVDIPNCPSDDESGVSPSSSTEECDLGNICTVEPGPQKYRQNIYKISFRNGCPHSNEIVSSFYSYDKETTSNKDNIPVHKTTSSEVDIAPLNHESNSVEESSTSSQTFAGRKDQGKINTSLGIKESRSAQLIPRMNKTKFIPRYLSTDINKFCRKIPVDNSRALLGKKAEYSIKGTGIKKIIRYEREMTAVKPLQPRATHDTIYNASDMKPIELNPATITLTGFNGFPGLGKARCEKDKTECQFPHEQMNKDTAQINVGYSDDAQVVHSESFTEDVSTIVDNVLQANLPELLSAGTSVNIMDKSIHQQTEFEDPQDEVRESVEKMISPEVSRKSPVLVDESSNSSDETILKERKESKRDKLHLDIATVRKERNKCLPQPPKRDEDAELLGFMVLVKCMIDRLPSHEVLCTSGAFKDKFIRYVLSSDVKEVSFPGCNLLPSLMTVKSLPSSSLVLCSPQGKRKFGEMFFRVNVGQYMIAVDAFSNKEWCKKLFKLSKEARQSKDRTESPKEKPLLGEVHYRSHALPMIYKFTKNSKKTLIYLPASDVAKAFPKCEHILKNLDVMIANDELKFTLRNRTATQEEAKSLMRYKAATGCLDLEDDSWHYLTSRSILISWDDFKKCFCAKSSIKEMTVRRLRTEDKRKENNPRDTPMKKVSSNMAPSGMALLSSALKSVRPTEKKKRSILEKNKTKKRKRSIDLIKKQYQSPKLANLKTSSPKKSKAIQRTSNPVTEMSMDHKLDTKKTYISPGEDVKTPSPKKYKVLQRPRTPVTAVSMEDKLDSQIEAISPGKTRKTSPKLLPRTSTPVTESEPLAKDSIGGKQSYSEKNRKEQKHAQSGENKICKGLWKMQQDILNEEKEKKHGKNIKLKPIVGSFQNKEEKNAIASRPPGSANPSQKQEGIRAHPPQTLEGNDQTHLEKILAEAVNVNPFNQSLESLKMVKKIDAELRLAKNEPPPPDLSKMEENKEQRLLQNQRQKENYVCENKRPGSKTIKTLTEQRTKPANNRDVGNQVEEGIPALQEKVIENTTLSGPSLQGSKDKNSRTLIGVSADTPLNVNDKDNGISSCLKESNRKDLAKLQPIKSACSPLKVKTKRKSKGKYIKTREPFNEKGNTKYGQKEVTKSLGEEDRRVKTTNNPYRSSPVKKRNTGDSWTWKPIKNVKNSKKKKPKAREKEESGEEISEKWASVSPKVIVENQRIIMRIIKSNKTNNQSKEISKQNTPREIEYSAEVGPKKHLERPKEFPVSGKETLRLYPRLSSTNEPSKSGLAVIENEGSHSLPYVLNNGYPYINIRSASFIFPKCQCNLVSRILKKSILLARHRLMCSYDEAELLSEEGRQLAMKPISSGTWMIRVDRIADHLPELNWVLEDSHKDIDGSKCLYT